MSPEDSAKMDGTVYSKMVGLGRDLCPSCLDVYRFGGCLGADGPATDQVFSGSFWREWRDRPPSVSWEEQPPLEEKFPWQPPEEHKKVPVAGHTAVHATHIRSVDIVWLLGGLDHCGTKPDGSPTVFYRALWQWRRSDGSLVRFRNFPEDCGIAYHSANYWIDDDGKKPGMLVYGGMRSSSCGGSIFRKNAWWFDYAGSGWLRRIGRRTCHTAKSEGT